MQKEVADKGKKAAGLNDELSMSFFSQYMISDPQMFTANILKAYENTSAALAEAWDKADSQGGPYSSATEFKNSLDSVIELVKGWLADPVAVSAAQAEFFNKFALLWNYTGQRMLGMQPEPLILPAKGDNRFRDPEWEKNPFFDFFKQTYLLICDWAERQLASMEGLSDRERHRAEFNLRQVTSALSPSNYMLLNPEVVRETLKSNAQNLVDGVTLLVDDLKHSSDLVKISQTDAKAFQLGRNLATTPGKVIYQNELLQLIQYSPTTDKVRERPLLIVPPWINKYYILDLTPQKSFIKYIVDSGYTVFVVSWVNPGPKLADRTFEDYLFNGILKATVAVQREAECAEINVLGYCVGGTALATTLAYLAKKNEAPYRCCTLLTTQVDFSLAGDLLLFTEDDQLNDLEELMNERGYLDGSRMANVFNMMRPRDLIWPYIINNYMLGKKPFAFDLLYWNQDSTRMAAANHKFYLREFYNANRLVRGEMVIGGEHLEVGKIKLPIFSVATREDHIAPARSVHRGTGMFGGPTEFVLAGSGHIAGIVNPPEKMKYCYWTSGKQNDDLDSWLQSAEQHPGSWWPYWTEWLQSYSGELIDARKPGRKLGIIEDAPGSYVKA